MRCTLLDIVGMWKSEGVALSNFTRISGTQASVMSSVVSSSAPSVKSSEASTNSSSKPWFLTMNPDNKDVLIWKAGIRLKLSDGTSTGGVMSAAVAKRHAGSITVSMKQLHETCILPLISVHWCCG